MGKRGWMFQRIYFCCKFLGRANNKKVHAMRFDCFFIHPLRFKVHLICFIAKSPWPIWKHNNSDLDRNPVNELPFIQTFEWSFPFINNSMYWFLFKKVTFNSESNIIFYSLRYRILTKSFFVRYGWPLRNLWDWILFRARDTVTGQSGYVTSPIFYFELNRCVSSASTRCPLVENQPQGKLGCE